MTDRTCVVCGDGLPPRHSVTCSKRCRTKRQNTSDAYRQAKVRYRNRGGERYSITCEQCGESAEVQKRAARFCSQECAKQSQRKPRRHRTRRQWDALLALRRAAKGVGPRSHPFYVDPAGIAHDRLPRRRAWKLSAKRRRAIYERDGWTCQLCLEPVDPRLPTLDDWAASIDHRVPRNRGGTDEDENLQLAHRWCNSVKGDGTYYSEEDLRCPA